MLLIILLIYTCPSYKVHVYTSSKKLNKNFYNVSTQLLSTSLDVSIESLITKMNGLNKRALRLTTESLFS